MDCLMGYSEKYENNLVNTEKKAFYLTAEYHDPWKNDSCMAQHTNACSCMIWYKLISIFFGFHAWSCLFMHVHAWSYITENRQKKLKSETLHDHALWSMFMHDYAQVLKCLKIQETTKFSVIFALAAKNRIFNFSTTNFYCFVRFNFTSFSFIIYCQWYQSILLFEKCKKFL